MAGPRLILLVMACWDTRIALLATAAVLAGSAVLFADLPAVRAWRPMPGAVRVAGGALRSAGMRTLVLVLVGVGVLFGSTEVAVTAATEASGSASLAGPILGLWGVGSFLGGVAATRRGGGPRSARGLALLLAVLGAGHLALAAVAGQLLLLGVLTVVAGTMIAPILATACAMVDDAVHLGAATEAFAWLATATAIGTSADAVTAGFLADSVGPATGFIVAGAGAGIAALSAIARRRTIPGGPISPAAGSTDTGLAPISSAAAEPAIA